MLSKTVWRSIIVPRHMRTANLNLKFVKCELLVDFIFVFVSPNSDVEND